MYFSACIDIHIHIFTKQFLYKQASHKYYTWQPQIPGVPWLLQVQRVASPTTTCGMISASTTCGMAWCLQVSCVWHGMCKSLVWHGVCKYHGWHGICKYHNTHTDKRCGAWQLDSTIWKYRSEYGFGSSFILPFKLKNNSYMVISCDIC